MCILFIAVKQHPDYPLIIAANRDEYFARPTESSHFWPNHPNVLAGKDLVAGGTWMGVTKTGEIASLTNIRNPEKMLDNARSRGELVLNYLTNQPDTRDYLNTLKTNKDHYNGYNLLLGRWDDLYVYNNHDNEAQPLTEGFYGLSNANLNSPWPKVNKGVKDLEEYCKNPGDLKDKVFFELMQDDTLAEDHLVQKTGAPQEWEKQLSSIFIRTPKYGTRASTLVLVDQSHQLHWHEKVYDENGECTQDIEHNIQLP